MNSKFENSLKTTAAVIAVAISGLACAPAHAETGPFDFIKKEAERMVKKEARNLVEDHAPAGAIIADAAFGEEAAQESGMSQNGTTVPTANSVQAPAAAGAAAGVNVSHADVNGDGINDIIIVKADGSVQIIPGQAAGMSQNGTTVPTADEVLAPELEQESTAQVGRGRTRARASISAAAIPARAGMSQNGTTVPTANTVQAPRVPQRASFTKFTGGIPARAGLSQNGTTVPTADTVQAPTRPQRADAEPQDAFMYFQVGSAALAGEATDNAHKDWIIIQSLDQSQFRGGVFVASGDVTGDGTPDIIVGPGLCKLVQNGTTVETASEINANLSQEEHVLLSRVGHYNWAETCAEGKLVQNGTTVATASEVQAPQGEEGILVGLLLPAVQQAREAARPARAGLSQNGTTVPTADTVKAPEREGEAVGSSTGGAGGAGKVKFDRLSFKKYSDE